MIACETAPGLVVRGHDQLLALAVSNLVDNALKHAPAGSTITVAAALEDGRPALSVADRGPGIPAADRERALGRFVRLDPSRGSPGAGLGLALVAAVARMHGAEVVLGDNGPGLHATVRFPAARGQLVTIRSTIPPATSAIPSVSRGRGRSPKAKRAVSQLKTSSTCPTAFTSAAEARVKAVNQPSEASIPAAPTGAAARQARSTFRTPPGARRRIQSPRISVCATVTTASVKAARVKYPASPASPSAAAR